MHDWSPYVPVGQRKAEARYYASEAAKKQKRTCQPVEIKGRVIAKSFWGKAWCDHVESLSDYANRLPRGRTYVRNGSVVDLVITPGNVKAIVAGSAPYDISISIKKLDTKTWNSIKRECSQSIDSLLDLLGGRLSDGVMQRLTDKKSGCFPTGRQIEMDCDCPDWSECCKHLAAVMYGIGSRLDTEPELLFLLRGVNQEELINQAVSKDNLAQELQSNSHDLAGEDLGAIFGIELESSSKVTTTEKRKKSKPKPKPSSNAKSASRSKVARAKKTTARNESAKSKKKATAKAKTGSKKVAKKKAVKKKVAKKKSATKKKSAVKKKAAKKALTTKASKKKKSTTTKPTSKKKTSPNSRTKKNAVKSSERSSSAKKKSKAKRPVK